MNKICFAFILLLVAAAVSEEGDDSLIRVGVEFYTNAPNGAEVVYQRGTFVYSKPSAFIYHKPEFIPDTTLAKPDFVSFSSQRFTVHSSHSSLQHTRAHAHSILLLVFSMHNAQFSFLRHGLIVSPLFLSLSISFLFFLLFYLSIHSPSSFLRMLSSPSFHFFLHSPSPSPSPSLSPSSSSSLFSASGGEGVGTHSGRGRLLRPRRTAHSPRRRVCEGEDTRLEAVCLLDYFLFDFKFCLICCASCLECLVS